MKHILIPTDFSIRSLNAVHAAIVKYKPEKIKITLFHLLSMSMDVSELLFRSMRNKHQKMAGDDFREACQVLQNRHSSAISTLSIQFGMGSTAAYVQNYLDGAQVDEILVCSNIKLTPPSSRSIDMLPLLKKSDKPVHEVNYTPGEQHADINILNVAQPGGLKIPKTEKDYVVEK